MEQANLMLPSSAAARSAAFPLTVMQQAYWIGEKNGYSLNTAAYLYRGFHARDLDLDRLARALLCVIQAHPTLRTCVVPDGTQYLADMPTRWHVPVCDLRPLGVAEQAARVASRMEHLDEHMPALDSGRQFACFVDRVHDGYHLHFLFRLLTLDGRSLALFFRDLTLAYQGHALDRSQSADYRNHVRQHYAAMAEPAYQQALDHWTERLRTLPGAPDLPIRDHEEIPKKSTFRRLQVCLDPDEVTQLALQARKLGATPNTVLCTLYADVLRLWARNPSFTLNLLISGRPADDPRYEHTIGNFSSTLLLEVPVVAGGLRERAGALQRQLFREIEHKAVSGVEVIRHMSRPGSIVPAMPVVFASTLGLSKDGTMATQAALGWRSHGSSMHTPQVWLDHQAYMEEGRLVLNWDYVEGVFLPGVIEEMFEVYRAHLAQVVNPGAQAASSPQLPPRFLEARRAANDTQRPLPSGLLHDFFLQACRRYPSQTALIAPDRQIRYAELLCRTTGLANALRHLGVGRNDLVAVVARRGWRQVTAAMAVVQAGGAYLPIAYELPEARKQWLAGQPGIKAILCERDAIAALQAPPSGVTVLALEDVLPEVPPAEPVALANVQGPEDLAYVIFTSGSTGQPKGVAIDHRGAVNTLQDVIGRFGLDCHDRVIGISEFNFDLSVYDIFATLGCGAALVLPPHSSTPSPADWAQCVKDHGVTVWNTVPALMEMQIEFSGARAAEVLSSLRLVMLSGDWIPVSLPGRLAAIAPAATLVSLGGATEASIWSNYFVVDHVDAGWRSIPYGWPLSNQSLHVLDDALQPTPTWAVGHLHIGGIGLAQGYYKDPERTGKSFITHPDTGERLYRTGDLGRYHPSGYLEFLGRSDSQVKIHGHRIELGEIDAALERCPFVRSAACMVRTVGERDRQLLAFYVRDPQAVPQDGVALDAALRRHLSGLLPHYMVPGVLAEIDRMPVTANGKIDRAALQARAATLQVARAEKILPRNEMEATLSSLWQKLLGTADPGIHDNFFELGGSSLMAVRLLNAIEATFRQTLPLASLLRHGTIAAQAGLLLEQAAPSPGAHGPTPSGPAAARQAVVVMRRASARVARQKVLLAVHPVGGNVLCYRDLLRLVPADVDVIGIQSRGNGRPRTVADMAATYVQELAPHLQRTDHVYLLGWSMGGVIAQEMTHSLEAAGISPAALTMIDSWVGRPDTQPGDVLEGFALLKSFVGDLLQDQGLPPGFDELASLPDLQRVAVLQAKLKGSDLGSLSGSGFDALIAEHGANFNALMQHRPRPSRAAMRQFRALRHAGFPYLVPFASADATHGSTPAPDPVYMDETHFSISQGECLRQIVATTLNPGADA
jgi:amino acid adenylation domain-containing protein